MGPNFDHGSVAAASNGGGGDAFGVQLLRGTRIIQGSEPHMAGYRGNLLFVGWMRFCWAPSGSSRVQSHLLPAVKRLGQCEAHLRVFVACLSSRKISLILLRVLLADSAGAAMV